MMHQIFTFIMKVVPDRIPTLQADLDAFQLAMPRPADLPFEKLTKLHFASLLIVPAPDSSFGPYLVFENNIDGTIAAYIEQLCRVAPTGLHTILSACEDYAVQSGDRDGLRAYLRQHVARPNASFVGNVGRDVARIQAECALVKYLEHAADSLVDLSATLAPQKFYDTLRAGVARTNGWALQPKSRLSAVEMFARRLRAWSMLPVAIMLLPVLAVATCVLRFCEFRDEADSDPISAKDIAKVVLQEDRLQQNHFANVSVVKPGIFRQSILRSVLFVIDRVAALCVNGTLSNLDNIHFAHWVLIDRGRRLMFLTNYDGSWENYLDDFIDKASSGLTAIWSNARGFPKTRFLVCGGARDERKFKAIARRTQIPTAVWYNAYPYLTVPGIENNSAIRDGLATPPRGAEVDRWLQRL